MPAHSGTQVKASPKYACSGDCRNDRAPRYSGLAMSGNSCSPASGLPVTHSKIDAGSSVGRASSIASGTITTSAPKPRMSHSS